MLSEKVKTFSGITDKTIDRSVGLFADISYCEKYQRVFNWILFSEIAQFDFPTRQDLVSVIILLSSHSYGKVQKIQINVTITV